MFDALMDWLGGFFSWIFDGIKALFGKLFGWLHFAWTIAAGIVAGVVWLFQEINNGVLAVIGAIGEWVAPATPVSTSGIAYYLSIANTFFPLSELFVFLIGYGTLLLGLTLYRFIKSWIPWGS